MNYNRPHTNCFKDKDIFMVKNINDCSSKKVQIAKSFKNLKNSDCSGCYDCDLCVYNIEDRPTSNSSGDEQGFSKLPKCGCIYKIPLRRGLVKSSPCFEYVNSDNNKGIIEVTNDPRVHKKKKLKRKTKYIDDIDFVPVRLISSEKTFPYKTNDKIKMNTARVTATTNARSPERKGNSWGRILKDQNATSKEQKKSTTVAQNVKQRTLTISKNQPQVQTKQRNTNVETPVQLKPIKTKPAVKEVSYPVPLVKKKSSHHSLKFEQPQDSRSEYSSSTSITGESIMLVDRSAQCSVTNLEGLEPNNWCNNINDVNQAGDSGLAFLNPVRTLNFLVRELRGKLSEGSEDDNMSRIIRDMENTIARLSKTPQGSLKDTWNTIISEDDLKAVLELLQNSPQFSKISETEKKTTEIQEKLETTCSKLEELCKHMEKTTLNKLREDKSRLLSELKSKNEELETTIQKLNQQELIAIELKRKNDEQSKLIMSLRDNQSKAAALNAILNEQLQDTEKKYQQAVTEMQFLMLEKEKNLVLMKCKDQDIQEMRKNLEEIKSLVVQHLSSFQLQSTNSGTALGKENKLDVDDITLISSLSNTVLQNTVKEIKDEQPVCSSPVETLTPSPDEDDSWRRISDVPKTAPDSPIQIKLAPVSEESDTKMPLQEPSSKNVCIKESLKNLFEEMKKQTKLGRNLSIHNLINLEEPNMCNWSDLDFSDDEIRSMTGFAITESEASK